MAKRPPIGGRRINPNRRNKDGAPGVPASPTVPEVSPFDLRGSTERGRARIHDLADSLGRRWGSSTALPLSTAPVAAIQRLPFGILMLDWRLRGGLVIGRINRLWGKKSTLKSTLCLRALRSAQNHCRYCKAPMVINPTTGEIDCRCPKPRFWVANEDDYGWLPQEAAITLSGGALPTGATVRTVKGVGKVYTLKCEPPPHLNFKADGRTPRKQKVKAKDIALVETYRCEPMRCVYLDSEGTIDRAWAVANGVDPSLVLLLGARWAEQSIETIELAMLTKEVDFLVIDSTSMMETKDGIEKGMHDRPKVAGKATLMGRFVRRFISLCADGGGLTGRLRPTLLCTSQVTTKGIGGSIPPWAGPTDGNVFEHGLALDVRMREAGYQFDPSGQYATSGDFSFEVKKDKAGGSPGSKGVVRFWLRETNDHPVGDSDDLKTVTEYARSFGDGYIQETNSSKTKFILHSDYLQDGKRGFSKVGDFKQFLTLNDTVYNDLRARVLQRLMLDGAILKVRE